MNKNGSGLPEDGDGFRLRGLNMTRIETFTDAAFAFAVTLLVISTQDVPGTYDEFMGALTGVPAFAMSFVIIMMFWYGHWKWSRRYGLEDLPTIVLSAALVFVVLVYVYPLKFMYSVTNYFFSDGRLGVDPEIGSMRQVYNIFAIYGAGFVGLNLLVAALNAYAYRMRDGLQLDELERYLTRAEVWAWLMVGGVGAISVATALFTKPSVLALPGWVYMSLAVIMPIYGVLAGRAAGRLRQTREPASPLR